MGAQLAFNSDIEIARIDGESSGNIETADVNLGVVWEPFRNWSLDLTGSWNHSETFPQAGGSDARVDRRVFLTLRRVHASGQLPTTYGFNSGKSGTGSLTGRVFFDANADGRWSPSEDVASGILVFLDGRYHRVTDRNGQFTFTPVFSGDHLVTISLDDVPLPFGLEDESARLTQVGVRRTTTVDFPLIRLDQ